MPRNQGAVSQRCTGAVRSSCREVKGRGRGRTKGYKSLEYTCKYDMNTDVKKERGSVAM